MITPSFGITATERVLPRMALDFTTASLDSRVTFTRTGNTATVTNSLGLIAPINANLPRFDFNPITLACKGLLIEEARTNLVLYSEQFDNIIWNKSQSTITSNAIVAPDGALTGDKLVENTATDIHWVSQSGVGLTGTYTLSAYAQAAERNWVYFIDNSTVTGRAFFNLSNGTIGTVSGSGSPSATITSVGDGWYRITMTITTAGAPIFRLGLAPSDNTTNYTGNGTSGAYIWGAQLEAGAFATSYIPTEAAAVTRNADVATMTGTNFSDWFNADEGTFETDFTSNGFVANQMLFSSTPGDLTATIQAYWTAATTITADGGVNATMTITGAQNTPSKFVYAYKTDNYAMSINAATPSTDASGTVPSTLSQLNIGHRNGSLIGNQYIRKFMYWPQRLTNAEVQAFSK